MDTCMPNNDTYLFQTSKVFEKNVTANLYKNIHVHLYNMHRHGIITFDYIFEMPYFTL